MVKHRLMSHYGLGDLFSPEFNELDELRELDDDCIADGDFFGGGMIPEPPEDIELEDGNVVVSELEELVADFELDEELDDGM